MLNNTINSVLCGICARYAFDNIALGVLVTAIMASFYIAVDRICKAIKESKEK